MSSAADSINHVLQYADTLPKGRARHMKRHYVYMISSADGELLYIGMAADVKKRIADHKYSSKFWRNDCQVFSFEASTRRQALDYEAQAIKTLRPKYNKMHNGQDDKVDQTHDTTAEAVEIP